MSLIDRREIFQAVKALRSAGGNVARALTTIDACALTVDNMLEKKEGKR